MTDGKYYGYARVSLAGRNVMTEVPDGYEPSLLPGEESIQRQIANFRDWATHRNVQLDDIEIDEGVSGIDIAWDDRPGFRRLMDKLQAGDHLVIWRLDRLDRGRGGITTSLRWLARHKVILHTIQESNGESFELNGIQGEILASIYEIATRIETDKLKAQFAAGTERCRRIGRKPPGKIGYGRKVIVRGKNERGHPIKWVVWDPVECAQIRELYRRCVIEDEPIWQVAMEFHERQKGRPCGNGSYWITMGEARYETHNVPDSNRGRRVLRWYKNILKAGKDIGYSDLPICTNNWKDVELENAGLDAVSKMWDLDIETTRKLLSHFNSPKALKKAKKKAKVPTCLQDDGITYWKAVETPTSSDADGAPS